jgi:hypothetical protein
MDTAITNDEVEVVIRNGQILTQNDLLEQAVLRNGNHVVFRQALNGNAATTAISPQGLVRIKGHTYIVGPRQGKSFRKTDGVPRTEIISFLTNNGQDIDAKKVVSVTAFTPIPHSEPDHDVALRSEKIITVQGSVEDTPAPEIPELPITVRDEKPLESQVLEVIGPILDAQAKEIAAPASTINSSVEPDAQPKLQEKKIKVNPFAEATDITPSAQPEKAVSPPAQPDQTAKKIELDVEKADVDKRGAFKAEKLTAARQKDVPPTSASVLLTADDPRFYSVKPVTERIGNFPLKAGEVLGQNPTEGNKFGYIETDLLTVADANLIINKIFDAADAQPGLGNFSAANVIITPDGYLTVGHRGNPVMMFERTILKVDNQIIKTVVGHDLTATSADRMSRIKISASTDEKEIYLVVGSKDLLSGRNRAAEYASIFEAAGKFTFPTIAQHVLSGAGDTDNVSLILMYVPKNLEKSIALYTVNVKPGSDQANKVHWLDDLIRRTLEGARPVCRPNQTSDLPPVIDAQAKRPNVIDLKQDWRASAFELGAWYVETKNGTLSSELMFGRTATDATHAINAIAALGKLGIPVLCPDSKDSGSKNVYFRIVGQENVGKLQDLASGLVRELKWDAAHKKNELGDYWYAPLDGFNNEAVKILGNALRTLGMTRVKTDDRLNGKLRFVIEDNQDIAKFEAIRNKWIRPASQPSESAADQRSQPKRRFWNPISWFGGKTPVVRPI